MNGPELFDLWAPADSAWSPWAKPILFAEPWLAPLSPQLLAAQTPASGAAPPAHPAAPAPPVSTLAAIPPNPPNPPISSMQPTSPAAPSQAVAPPPGPPQPELPPLDLSGFAPSESMAVVVDLAGVRSIEAGLLLAAQGYRPVPLFNGAPHPGALVSTEPLFRALRDGVETLRSTWSGTEAPPAFLLDSRRQSPKGSAAPGSYDNRWLVFPQDFPSATFLQSRQVRRVLLLQESGNTQPAEDLAHVLRRWQEAGIEILLAHPVAGSSLAPLEVEKPSRFRTLSYRALALFGLHRNSAGGFGSVIPMPPAGGGGGGLGFG